MVRGFSPSHQVIKRANAQIGSLKEQLGIVAADVRRLKFQSARRSERPYVGCYDIFFATGSLTFDEK
jgi:hypothetical protein